MTWAKSFPSPVGASPGSGLKLVIWQLLLPCLCTSTENLHTLYAFPIVTVLKYQTAIIVG